MVNVIILAFIAAGTWWLTGFDKTPGGESKRDHHLTRALRCLAVVLLSALFLGTIELRASLAFAPLLIICPMSIAIVLRSSISEIGAQGFLRWIDPELHDRREFDPKKTGRYQDAIAHLIHNGRREEAIKLCEELKASGEVDEQTLKHTLDFLGVKQDYDKPSNPLTIAARLREEHKFAEAETALLALLKQKPTDTGAALMLMRVYAQDWQDPQRAYKVLEQFGQQPHVDPAHVEFARRSIPEWTVSGRGGTGVPPVESGVPPDSARARIDQATLGAARTTSPQASPTAAPFDPATLDQLLAAGSLGSAVELLEREIKQRPMDWKLQLNLAEVYAVHCGDMTRAEKIVNRLEQQPGFGADHTTYVRAKLEEWRTTAKPKSG